MMRWIELYVGGVFFFCLSPLDLFGTGPLIADQFMVDRRPSLYDRNQGEREREDRRRWRESQSQIGLEEMEEEYSLSTPYYGEGIGSGIQSQRGRAL